MNDLERIEQELGSIRLTPSKTTDQRVLAAAAQALSQQHHAEQEGSVLAPIAQEGPSWLGRVAVLGKYRKMGLGLAAAGVILVMLLIVWPGSHMSQVSAEEVLARTTKALRSVKAYHYQMRALGVPSPLLREFWAQGNRIYARGLREGKLVAEFWADPTRIVRYDRETSKVTISDANPGLLRAMGGIAMVRNFKPEDWQPLPGSRVKRDGRWYRVFELPGAGTFRGMGRSGETKMRLWVDEKDYLPARLEGQLKPPGTGEWERFLEIEFLWDDEEVREDLFVPSYPDTAQVDDRRQLPDPEAGQETPPVAPEEMTKPIVTLEQGVALEKLWIHPMGLVVLRIDLGSRQPFGQPPELEQADKNPWGLEPKEIPLALRGQAFFQGPLEVRPLGAGAVRGRRAVYLLHEFEPAGEGIVPETLTFRYLLARRRAPSEGSFQAYLDSVLKDPSSWHLYEFTIATRDYITDRIPEEIYGSPNLHAAKIMIPALKEIMQRFEAEGNGDKVQEFIRSQGPGTQRLLKKIREDH